MNTTNLRTVTLGEILDVPVHPVADVFPMLEKTVDEHKRTTLTLSELADSIVEHGLQEPLVFYNDQLMDGRNRRAACELAIKLLKVQADEFEVEVEDFVGTEEEAEEYIFTLNLDRRDLTPGQRAETAVRYWDLYDGRHGGDRKSDQADKLVGLKGETPEILARRFRVSQGYIKDVRRIQREAEEKEAAAREAVAEAERQRKLVEEKQAELAAAKESGDTLRFKDTTTAINNATQSAAESQEQASNYQREANDRRTALNRVRSGKATLNSVKKEAQQTGKDERELAIEKATQKFSDGYNKVMDAGPFLLKEGRPNDQEHVRRRFISICEVFGDLEEVEGALKPEFYFEPEMPRTDAETRWGGEIRIRLGGVDRMIQEHEVTPEFVATNSDFLPVLFRLQEFLSNVEDIINANES